MRSEIVVSVASIGRTSVGKLEPSPSPSSDVLFTKLTFTLDAACTAQMAESGIDAPGAELGGTKPEHMRLRHEADKGRVLQQPDTEMLAACGIVAGASLLLA